MALFVKVWVFSFSRLLRSARGGSNPTWDIYMVTIAFQTDPLYNASNIVFKVLILWLIVFLIWWLIIIIMYNKYYHNDEPLVFALVKFRSSSNVKVRHCQFFSSDSNQFLVILIRSSELASYKQLLNHEKTFSILAWRITLNCVEAART